MMQGKQVTRVSLRKSESSSMESTAIVKDNVRALGLIYFAAMFENLRIFEAADKLVASFFNGLLPVGPGEAGAKLF